MANEIIFSKEGVQVIKVADRVYFRRADWGAKEQCNSGYILLSDGVAAIDASTKEGAVEMMEEAAALFGKPITHVILTHGHWDHADGLPALIKGGAKNLIAAEGAVSLLEANGVKLPEFTLRIADKARFDIDGIGFEAFTFGKAVHSDGDLFISIPAHNLVFTGDAVSEAPFLFFKNGNAANWIETLDAMESLGFSTLCVGHGGVKDGAHYADQRAYIQALRDAMRAFIAKSGATDPSEEAGAKAAKEAAGDPANAGAALAVKINGAEKAISHMSQVYTLLLEGKG